MEEELLDLQQELLKAEKESEELQVQQELQAIEKENRRINGTIKTRNYQEIEKLEAEAEKAVIEAERSSTTKRIR